LLVLRNNQEPTEFVWRHWRDDWGELEQEDIQENAFSLTRGLRLLSAYKLKDETRIWIITDADYKNSHTFSSAMSMLQ